MEKTLVIVLTSSELSQFLKLKSFVESGPSTNSTRVSGAYGILKFGCPVLVEMTHNAVTK